MPVIPVGVYANVIFSGEVVFRAVMYFPVVP